MNTRTFWSVLLFTLLWWSLTTGMFLYGMRRDPWVGLIGASASSAPLPIAAVIAAVLPFVFCLSLGFSAQWLIGMGNSGIRGGHESIRWPFVMLLVLILSSMAVRTVPAEQAGDAQTPQPAGDQARAAAEEQPKDNEQHSLLEELKADDSKTRMAALTKLTKLGPEAAFAVPILVTFLEREDSYEKTLTIRCLGQIGPAAKEAVPSLHAILKSQEKSVFLRFEAARALARMGPAGEVAIPTLIATLEDPGESKRTVPSGAREALGLIAPFFRKGDDGSVYLDSRDSVIGHALGALGTFGPAAREAVPSIQRVRDDPDTLPIIRDMAVEVLKRIQPAPAVQPQQGGSNPTPPRSGS